MPPTDRSNWLNSNGTNDQNGQFQRIIKTVYDVYDFAVYGSWNLIKETNLSAMTMMTDWMDWKKRPTHHGRMRWIKHKQNVNQNVNQI